MAYEGENIDLKLSEMADSPQAKKQKTCSDQKSNDVGTNHERLVKDFQISEVLNQNAQVKTICLRGRYRDKPEDAVLILEKTPFSVDSVKEVFCEETGVEVILQNDIYNSMKIFPPPSCNAIKSSIIYPATAKHLDKYRFQPKVMLSETPEDYRLITLPYIESAGFSIQWVYNILEKKTESERIVFEDPDHTMGFILLPDLKWDGIQVENLYLVAIVHDRSIRSIRDLTEKHLGLLENILESGTSAIVKKYDVSSDRLRIFFHYQPSYYHLHVHFAHLDYDAPGINAGKAHLLADVIDNIRLDGGFYQKKTLVFYINEGHELCCKFKQCGKLKV